MTGPRIAGADAATESRAETGAAVYFQKDPIVTQLEKLAGAGRTGVLRVPGSPGGAIYLRRGEVAHAESPRTPGPGGWLREQQAGNAPVIPSPLVRAWAAREATIDAVMELLSGGSRSSRFGASEASPVHDAGSISVEALLAEVARRQRIVTQLSAFLTADTAVTRNPRMKARAVQVSALQWGLLSRVGDRSTPRSLAWEAGHSVFSATIEVFRLAVLQLLSVIDAPGRRLPEGPGDTPGHKRPAISFTRAVIG